MLLSCERLVQGTVDLVNSLRSHEEAMQQLNLQLGVNERLKAQLDQSMSDHMNTKVALNGAQQSKEAELAQHQKRIEELQAQLQGKLGNSAPLPDPFLAVLQH